MSEDQSHWKRTSSPRFFLNVDVLSRVFRGKFKDALKEAFQRHQISFHGQLSHLADPKHFARLIRSLYRQKWVVYAKAPFGGPEHVLHYLARYTHRIAITNSRLVRLEGEEVTFTWKDYADHDRIREMTLSGEEFLRRFLLHVLPDRFVRIRYYGLLANRHREKTLALCREVLPGPPARPKPPKTDWSDRLQSLTGIDPLRCEVCGQKALRLVGEVAPARAPRAPPR